MQELLANPAVQAAALPFVVALVVAAVLLPARLVAWAIVAGLATCAALTIGLALEPLTSARKIVLCMIGAGVLVTVVEVTRRNDWPIGAGLAVLAGAAGVWIAIRVLQQKESMPVAIGLGAAAAAYAAAWVAAGWRWSADSVRGSSIALAAGLGSGALALLGASASLAQMGIAVGASAGGALLVQLLAGRSFAPGASIAVAGALAAALIGLLAVAAGSLSWYALVPMLAIPWAASLPRTEEGARWRSAILGSLAALVPVLLAVAVAWFTAAPSA